MIKAAMDAIDDDELHLATLACAKLARLVQGTLSIGVPALAMGVPEPRVFLDRQFQVMASFVEVLHTISGTVRNTQEILRLREKSTSVSQRLAKLRRELFVHLDSPSPQSAALRPARDAACELCDAIADYADRILLDRSIVEDVKANVQQVFESLERVSVQTESSVA